MTSNVNISIGGVALLGALLNVGCAGAPGDASDREQAQAETTGAAGPIHGLAGKCLDDSGDATADGTKIQLYTCNGTDAQSWTFTPSAQLVGPGGKCLDVRGDEQKAGTIVQLWTCNGTAAQTWTQEGQTLVSSGGYCLDVRGGGSSDGTQLEIWGCNGQSNQAWSLPASAPVAGGGADAGGSGPGSGGGGGGGGESGVGAGGAGTVLVTPAYFVSPDGSDSNPGTTASAPFQTPEKAQSAMQAQGLAAYTTYLMGGTYSRSTSLDLTGYYDQNKSWLAYPGQTPVLDGGGAQVHGVDLSGTGITVRGLTVQNFQSGIFAKYGDHITVDHNTVNSITTPDWRTNILGASIFFLRVSYSSISNNDVEGNTAGGIVVNGGGAGDNNSYDTVSGNLIQNTCTAVDDCGALYFRDVGHVSVGQVISGNTIVNFHPNTTDESAGIYIDDETSNVTVTGNSVEGPGQYAFLIHGGDHNTLRGNTVVLGQMYRLGLYQDDQGSGGVNYGMAGNVFSGNTIDASSLSSAASQGGLWDFLDQSTTGISKPTDEGNTYTTTQNNLPELGPIVDTAPTLN